LLDAILKIYIVVLLINFKSRRQVAIHKIQRNKRFVSACPRSQLQLQLSKLLCHRPALLKLLTEEKLLQLSKYPFLLNQLRQKSELPVAQKDTAKKTTEATAPAAQVEAAPVEAKAQAVKKKTAKVRKTVSADNAFDTSVAAVTALGAIGLAVFLFMLGSGN
jgi:hypothetical protein